MTSEGDRLEGQSFGIVEAPRSSIATLVRILINPITALPSAVFEAGVVVTQVFGRTRLHLSDPSLIHQALVRNADRLTKGDEIARMLGPALGNGLLTADGASWRWQRQSMAPAFQPDKLHAFVPSMIAAAKKTRDLWVAEGAAPRDIGHDMMRTTFQIIIDTMLSGPGEIDAAKVERSVADYLKTTSWALVMALARMPLWMPYPGRRRAERSVIYLRGTIMAMVAARRHRRAAGDLVDLLLAAKDSETGRSMTDEEITDNLVTFITAGHETTALALTWAFFLLAAHPAIEARVLAEIETVTGGAEIGPDHIEKLTFTRQVIFETMRLYPPAALIIRTARAPFDLSGAHVAAGTLINVPIYAVHRHRRLWDRPEDFDPDRFSAEASKTRHRYAFMPFGAGPRICIGTLFATLEAVAILAILLKAVRVRRADREAIEPILRVTLRPSKKIMMRVTPRA